MSFIYWMFPLVVDEKSDRDLFEDVIEYLFWDDMEDLFGYVMADYVGENCILFWYIPPQYPLVVMIRILFVEGPSLVL